jgi:hypothetical protein
VLHQSVSNRTSNRLNPLHVLTQTGLTAYSGECCEAASPINTTFPLVKRSSGGLRIKVNTLTSSVILFQSSQLTTKETWKRSIVDESGYVPKKLFDCRMHVLCAFEQGLYSCWETPVGFFINKDSQLSPSTNEAHLTPCALQVCSRVMEDGAIEYLPVGKSVRS